jgi:hypothetical protein
MARGRGGSKKKSTRKGKSKDGDVGGQRVHLVPWNSDPLTDRLVLPKAIGGVYTTRKVSAVTSAITQSSTVAVFGAINIQANNNITDFSSLSSVFDQYRIMAVEIMFRPQAQSPAPTASSKGFLYTVIDYDDSTVLTSVSQAEAYENCIATEAWQSQRRCFKPRAALAAYSGSFTSYANVEAPWIDAASNGVQHYGIKYAIDVGTAGSLAVFDWTMAVVVQFRASR